MSLSFKLNRWGITSIFLGLALLCVVFTASVTPAWAQSAAGTVTGVVTDQQQAVVAGADIRLVDVTTGSARSTASNDVGRYTITNVPPGTYNLTVNKAGFTAAQLTNQKVDVGEVLTLNIPLQVGATTTTVEVQATAGADLQTLNATVGSTITNESLNLMPNLGRDASTLSVLQVGVTPLGTVAGTAVDQNTYQLDGGNNSDDMAGGNTTYTPGNGYIGTGSSGGTPSGVMPTPIESIEEIKIGTSAQTADFSGGAGSQVQMVTKRGTNQFHGALYEFYFANNVGAAELWKNNHTLVAAPGGGLEATPLPDTHRNRFGGALGGPVGPKFWGGRTYFFANFEGMRYPNVANFERAVPSALLRQGIVQFTNSAGVLTSYNLNPTTVNGIAPSQCTTSGASGPCDPRMLGLNPDVAKIWSQMPLPNDPSYTVSGGYADGVNAQGYLGQVALPQTSNFFVARIDHDFGEKWKFMSSYRYYSYQQQTTNQTVMSPSGQYTAIAPRPQKPDYFIGGLTTTITNNITNDFRANYLRNFWQWTDAAGQPQLAGLGGALEMGGEGAGTNALIPVNVNSQSTRQRFWDGHDQNYNDNVSALKGNHLFQFGGSYQRNYDFHERNDNGVGIDTSITYQLNNGSGLSASAFPTPAGLATANASTYDLYYAEVLGIVGQSQVMYTRSGPNLTLNPVGTPGFDQSIIPTYDLYFTDTWHIRPNLTMTYGLSWTLAMPPYEINGKQVQMVDVAGNPINLESYLAQKQTAALAGNVYDPTVGFETVRNIGTGEKYPYNPYYKDFSPRFSLAWNPTYTNGLMGKVFGDGKTVVRGGYARIFGRANGVDLVLVPLLGPGILQAVSCYPASNGTCASASSLSPATAFRIGVDGNSAPLPAVSQNFAQPYYPGVNGNAAAADGSQIDPNFRPSVSDEFNFTIQRAAGTKGLFEVGYIGRKIGHEFQEINIDAVPTMTTLNGQSFAQAYANVYQEIANNQPVTQQPFFEAAMGGANSAFCAGASSCTAQIVNKFSSDIKAVQVYNLWTSMALQPGYTLGRTLLASPALGGSSINTQLSALEFDTSNGYGSYNAAFMRFTSHAWHGLTATSNFTWSRALGTGSVVQATSSSTVPDPWDLGYGYGAQPFDYKFVYSLSTLYQTPWFKSQQGLMGRVLGGWSIAPLFTAASGAPLQINVGTGSTEDAQAFGEVYGNSNSALYENAVPTAPFTGGNSAHYNVTATNGIGTSSNTGMNLFANPSATFAEFRLPILGVDTNQGGAGYIRGLPTWNLDATVSKDIRATERFRATLIIQVVNVLNHFQAANPSMDINSPTSWGVITNQATTANGVQSRWMEFGLRLGF